MRDKREKFSFSLFKEDLHGPCGADVLHVKELVGNLGKMMSITSP